MDSFEDAYNRGYDDGVEWCIEWLDNYINYMIIQDVDLDKIRQVETVLEDMRITVDEQ